MNIVLIGYRGTGKSSVAALLADRLGRQYISTDAEVIARAKQSIPDIVKTFGWEHFRNLESDVCRELETRDRLIIDTGGGAILRPQNVEALQANGRVFWLTAEVATIARRIGGDTQRPSLTGTQSFVDEISSVLAERRPIYSAAAHHVIPTDESTTEHVAERILALI